jgi:hypothetical protein
MTSSRARGADTLTIQATITKGHDGSDRYAVSVVLKENGAARQLVDKALASCFEAETVARTFATQNNVLWHKVELVYRQGGHGRLPLRSL